MIRRLLLPLSLLALLGAPALAEHTSSLDPRLARQIDDVFAEWIAADEPGGVVLILDEGEEIFRGSWGLSQVELGVRSDPGHVYAIGSLTKQFTAAAALLLVDEGRMSLDSTLASLLPGFPVTGASIRVRHLLGHTTGLVNIANVPEWSATWGRETTPDELIDLFRRKPPVDAPGTRFEYNNSGYVLVGRAIELLTGKSWGEFLAERILRPLGMSSTAVNDHGAIVPGRAPGYARTQDGWQNTKAELHPSQLYAAGALRSNLDDLARFHRALAGGRLLSAAALEAMTTPGELVDGRRTGYGAGWAVSRQRGRTVLEHGGASYGYYSAVVWLPEEGVWGAVMTNRYGFGDEARSRLARAVMLAAGWPARETPALVDGTVLDEIAGVYLAEHDRSLRLGVTRDGDHLMTSAGDEVGRPALPRSPTEFFRPESGEELEIERDDQGRVLRIVARRSYRGETRWRRAAEEVQAELASSAPAAPTPAVAVANPEAYVGRYALGPGLEAVVRLENDALVVDVLGFQSVPLLATGEHAFSFPSAFGSVHFELRDGRAVALTFSQGGQVMQGARVE